MNAPLCHSKARTCPKCRERARVPYGPYCAPCHAAEVREARSQLPREQFTSKACPRCDTGMRFADQSYCRNCQTAYMRTWRKIKVGVDV